MADGRERLFEMMTTTPQDRAARAVFGHMNGTVDDEALQRELGPIDYSERLPAQPYRGQLGASAGPAPTFLDRVRGFGNQASSFLDEATGIPAAGRAGEALARGEMGQGAREALFALPSRAAAIGGMLMPGAEAQAPDPRVRRIQDLNREVVGYRQKLEEMGTKKFPSTTARKAASDPYLSAIEKAQGEAARLQEQLDTEFKDAEDRRLAAERGAAWANTPFAKKYPNAPAAIAGLGMVGSVAFPALRGRRAVTAYERDAQSLSQRVNEAVTRANDATLPAKTRTQAANEARELQAQYAELRQAGPRSGGHGRAFVEGAVPFEVGLATPSIIDYLNSAPGSELRNYTLHANDPISNTGEVASRYGLGFGFGGVLGELGHIMSDRLANPSTDYGAEVRALNKRYSDPRKPSAPRRRK
jgi:hypothetical protein